MLHRIGSVLHRRFTVVMCSCSVIFCIGNLSVRLQMRCLKVVVRSSCVIGGGLMVRIDCGMWYFGCHKIFLLK